MHVLVFFVRNPQGSSEERGAFSRNATNKGGGDLPSVCRATPISSLVPSAILALLIIVGISTDCEGICYRIYVRPAKILDQVKREAHSLETSLKHGSRGEIFCRFAERHLYLHLSQNSLVMPSGLTIIVVLCNFDAYITSMYMYIIVFGKFPRIFESIPDIFLYDNCIFCFFLTNFQRKSTKMRPKQVCIINFIVKAFNN